MFSSGISQRNPFSRRLDFINNGQPYEMVYSLEKPELVIKIGFLHF